MHDIFIQSKVKKSLLHYVLLSVGLLRSTLFLDEFRNIYIY